MIRTATRPRGVDARKPEQVESTDLATAALDFHSFALKDLLDRLDAQGLSIIQFFLLLHLSRSGRLTMAEIAERMKHTTAASTTLVDRLCKIKYVTRARDTDDRRVVYARLTNQGEAIIEKLRNGLVDKVLSELSVQDRKEFGRINKHLLGRFEQQEMLAGS